MPNTIPKRCPGPGLWSCAVVAQAALVGAFLPHRPPTDRPRSALGNIYRTSDDRRPSWGGRRHCSRKCRRSQLDFT
ncbi:MAG TPA: hypothetical protein VK681_03425 [Reyranella sp.]|nr:hypothetical protein [Reyranella sp.]